MQNLVFSLNINTRCGESVKAREMVREKARVQFFFVSLKEFGLNCKTKTSKSFKYIGCSVSQMTEDAVYKNKPTIRNWRLS